jgi:ubiquinone biosynthesis protein
MASILTTARDLERARQIVGVLASHGFGEMLGRTGLASLVPGARENKDRSRIPLGERIRLVLQDLGPSAVKLGQIASTRPDLIPADVMVELKKLQDAVPPEPFEQIKATIEADLGATIDEVFSEIDERPLASASIGQVHRAKLRMPDGADADVVVKVQRTNVRDVVQRDIDLLYWLSHSIERNIPEMRLYNPVKMVGEFDQAITAELDYTQEADNCERFARNFDGHPHVKFPKVYRSASSRRVLTLEFFPGLKINDACRDHGFPGELIARRSVEIIIKQIFEDGFFHADPHPGNIFVLGTPEAPVIGIIDLGMVGRLTPALRDKTIDLMVAAVREDLQGVADALFAIGRPTRKVDRHAYDAEVAMLAGKYLGKKLEEIELSAMIRDLANGAQKYGIEVPADFLLFGKSLMTVEGVGKEIYPQLDVFAEVKPYFLRLIKARYSPERMTQDFLRSAMKLSGAATDMPVQLQEILDDLRKGAFRLEIRESSLRTAADELGRRLFAGMVVGSMFVAAAIVVAAKDYWTAGIIAVGGVGYAGMHRMGVFFLNRRRKFDEK